MTFYDAVYVLVRDIPRGRVMTYGQVAAVLGAPRAARAVGYAMRAAPDGGPGQRVINRHGGISPRGDGEGALLQRALLERERVTFRDDDTCDLKKYGWTPDEPELYYYDGNMDLPFRR
jgi:methylated-DNA-protein-cysteine methyltransferase related protein